MSLDSYTPLQNGIPVNLADNVIYIERKPQRELRSVVHCFWTLASSRRLSHDFIYTIMPDACIDLVFNANDISEPLLMTPHLQIIELNLKKSFRYVGIRFKPGVFANSALNTQSLVGHQHETNEICGLDLHMHNLDVTTARTNNDSFLALEQLASNMLKARAVAPNALVENVIRGMQLGLSVDNVAHKIGYSSRQLRRKVTEQTGFSPIQLRRILRFQLALSSQDVSMRFADQSHLIKEFQRITGTSYKSFIRKFS